MGRVGAILLGLVLLGGVCTGVGPAGARVKEEGSKVDDSGVGSAAEWEAQKAVLRERLWGLLGDVPPVFTPEVTIHSTQKRPGYVLERFTFDNGAGATVYGYMMIPEGHEGRGPAILYNHYHGGKYGQGKEEVLIRAFGRDERGHKLITGEELVRAGYVVMCIDAYAFGERQFHGPRGKREAKGSVESALFKAFLWEGKTLWGMMVRDDVLALNYLVSREEVDAERIAAMGMSMGSTRTWWLAALDERVKVAVCVACLTRYQELIEEGSLYCHGIYYFVPGMIGEGMDIEKLVGLIAPRALLTLAGDSDAGSPVSGVRIINEFQRGVYGLYGKGDYFRAVIYEGVGHVYTPEMWNETILWLKRHL